MTLATSISLKEAHLRAGALETTINGASTSGSPVMRSDAVDLGPGLQLSFSRSTVDNALEVESQFQASRSLMVMVDGDVSTDYEHAGLVNFSAGRWAIVGQPSLFSTRSQVRPRQSLHFLGLRMSEAWAEDLTAGESDGPLSYLLGTHKPHPHLATGMLNGGALAAVQALLNNTAQGACRRLVATARVLDLLMALAPSSEADFSGMSKAAYAKCSQARDILTSTFHAPPTIFELARMVGVSPTTLKRDFQQIYGLPIGRFVSRTRLAEARRLLESGDYRVSEVAYRTGYTPAAFSAAFLREFGLTPRDIKKSV